MEREFIAVGAYVPIGDVRAYCVEVGVPRKWKCRACAFENTERCETLLCRARERNEDFDVFFTVKLNPK